MKIYLSLQVEFLNILGFIYTVKNNNSVKSPLSISNVRLSFIKSQKILIIMIDILIKYKYKIKDQTANFTENIKTKKM